MLRGKKKAEAWCYSKKKLVSQKEISHSAGSLSDFCQERLTAMGQ